MQEETIISAKILNRKSSVNTATAREYEEALRCFTKKIVVLDDDPTGIQTVHGVSVFTEWSCESLERGFLEKARMFFVLTNSRSFTRKKTTEVHREIARNLLEVSKRTDKEFVLVSRGDSTLRGYYPLETEVLRQELERGGLQIDGEIICPFFKEGGRFTIGDVHYVRDGDRLLPAGMTEFARDKTFGYHSSNLRDWCVEKCGAACRAEEIQSVSLEALRTADIGAVESLLMQTSRFGKVIVNATDDTDLEVFITAFCRVAARGKQFLFRSAAAIPKVLGGIVQRPLLTHAELVTKGSKNGGILLVGSHVERTTRQFDELRASNCALTFLEFDQHQVLKSGGLEQERKRVTALVEAEIARGQSVVVFTRRERFDLPDGGPEEQLRVSTEISDALTGVVGGLNVRPSFLVAKGGITSSDVGTKALGVKQATVLGQVLPGVPVWLTGEESKFPGMPYVIFPGNVGTESALCEAMQLLTGQSGTEEIE